MDTVPLYRHTYRSHDPSIDHARVLEERIELHRRLALPLACILMSLAAVPLGITSRRAGKSGAVVLTVAIALVYYMGLISCISLARQGALRPEIAVWLPDIVFAIFALLMITRLEVGRRSRHHGRRDRRFPIAAPEAEGTRRACHRPFRAARLGIAIPSAARIGGYLRVEQFSVLFLAAADDLRGDFSRVHVFRAC